MKNNIINHNLFLLGKLQGIGSRSSKRILFDLMKKKDNLLKPLIDSLQSLHDSIQQCDTCYNLDISNPCNICASENRDRSYLCIVEDIASLWAIEKASESNGSYNGLYFVLGGSLSATKGITPEILKIPQLISRVTHSTIKEIILATPSTTEGKITNNYICDLIPANIRVSHLAQGIPIGGEIDYLDEITLSTAINLRTNTR